MNIVEKCSREIERVTVLRERWRAIGDRMYDGASGVKFTVNVTPAITIMTAAIESGHTALGAGDAVAIIAAIRELEAFFE